MFFIIHMTWLIKYHVYCHCVGDLHCGDSPAIHGDDMDHVVTGDGDAFGDVKCPGD